MIQRSEHPRPQFMRKNWENLNGEWQFEIDNSISGKDKKLFEKGKKLSQSITVPFCPESKLSGIGNTDFMNAVWYKRTVNIKKTEDIVRLHFGAVDNISTLYINGKEAFYHKGGYTPFYKDINEFLVDGENEICLCAVDDTRSDMVPSGKQCFKYNSVGCHYTRTTGIWQTVWLEFLPKTHVKSVKYYPNIQDGSITVRAFLEGKGDFKLKATFKNKEMGEYFLKNASGEISFNLKLNETYLWEIGKGNLYDVEISFNDDNITSYFGLRQIRFDGMKFMLNERSVFQRLVLDQGYYPDGIYTAPSDEALKNDILLAQKAGFNGARLHQKVFEERFLYHADRLGYIVWGEFASWGLDHTKPMAIYSVLPEWLEELERDFNHPSIIGWCPFNETGDKNHNKQYDPLLINIYDVTKAVDQTRPCIDSSGYFHVKTDVFSVHDYSQSEEEFKERYGGFKKGEEFFNNGHLVAQKYGNRQKHNGEPIFVAEYGGIAYAPNENGWGYGAVKTPEDFYDRFERLTSVIMNNENIFGVCYTQLTDVEQEQNGMFYYDRTEKFDVTPIKNILDRKAKIEE